MASRTFRPRRRTQLVVGLTAVIGLLGANPAMSAATGPAQLEDTAPAAPTGSTATPAAPSNVSLLQVRTSLLGVHTWYRQMQDGYPVVGGLYAEHQTTSGPNAGRFATWDGRVAVQPVASTDATVTAEAAIAAAVAATEGTPLTFVAPSLWVLPGTPSRLAWQVTTVTSGEVGASNVSYVDAQTGAVLLSVVESKSTGSAETTEATAAPEAKWVTGKARTFDPNPVVKLQDQDITDENDSNDAVPDKAYSVRKLANLDKSHTLVGRWAKIVNDDIASSRDDEYLFKRADDRFEQVMGYYALDTEQAYYQKLGFDDVNAEPQKISTNTIPDDNSFYSPGQDLIVTGTGGVDDAEDPEVTWHEGGHATQDDQVPGFGSSTEAGSIGEAFGDYIAVTLGAEFGKDTKVTPSWCVMDWDATSYSPGPIHCLRTTQEDKHYPEDLTGEVHADGEIWSQALYEMSLALGRDKATTAIIEAQFSFTPSIGMTNAAKITVDTTKDLYGKKSADKAKKAFKERGIL